MVQNSTGEYTDRTLKTLLIKEKGEQKNRKLVLQEEMTLYRNIKYKDQ